MNKTQKFLFASFLVAGLMMVVSTESIASTFASVSGSYSDIGDNFIALFQTWVKGNVGKLIALFAVFGGVISFIMKRDVSGFVYGLIGGALTGGILGLASLMFDTGSNAFGATALNVVKEGVQYSVDFINGTVH